MLELANRGWTQSRIAKALKRSQSSVSRFISCSRRYALTHNRPPFWEAYRDLDGHGDKRPEAQGLPGDGPAEPVQRADGAPMAEDSPRRSFLECAREVGQLLLKARAEVMAKSRANIMGQPYAGGEYLDDLAAKINAAQVAAREAMRDEFLRHRCRVGDTESRRGVAKLLGKDGLSRAEAVACSDRLHAGLYPADADMERFQDAYMAFVLRRGKADMAAGEAELEREEQEMIDKAITDSMTLFADETGLDPETPTEEFVERWNRWREARLASADCHGHAPRTDGA
jgi:hypothetical protein